MVPVSAVGGAVVTTPVAGAAVNSGEVPITALGRGASVKALVGVDVDDSPVVSQAENRAAMKTTTIETANQECHLFMTLHRAGEYPETCFRIRPYQNMAHLPLSPAKLSPADLSNPLSALVPRSPETPSSLKSAPTMIVSRSPRAIPGSPRPGTRSNHGWMSPRTAAA